MIKIECDDASDLTGLMRETIDAKVALNTTQAALFKEQDKCYDLRSQVESLTREIERLKANPPLPNYNRTLSDLIEAVKAGNRIGSIKVIREVTGLGLKESKDLFEAAYDGRKVA